MSGQRFVRTHRCGELGSRDIGQQVTLAGWVHARRDHGGLIFIDLRDRAGIVQVVVSPQVAEPEAFRAAEVVRSEYVLQVAGEVRRRPPGTENPRLATGEIEVYARTIDILNRARTPPFEIEDGIEVDEAVRLRYRYLDLRRPEMQRALEVRHRAARALREFLDREGFWEVETPFLTKSTPEGARDYLVPSRLHPGKFYALPQSPQLFKQILMVAGVERYFQLVRCFRDEDLRADRQPEFTQLDLEMSFVAEDDVIELVERMLVPLCRAATGLEVDIPFPRIPYREALERYGTDRPDTRFGLELRDLFSSRRQRTISLARGIAIEGTAILARECQDRLAAYFDEGFLNRCRAFLHQPGISVVQAARLLHDHLGERLHALHDPTEGGLATGLRELALASGYGVTVDARAIPIYPETRALCDALGLDPLGLIASGALLAAVEPGTSGEALALLQQAGIPAAAIGRVEADPARLDLVTDAGVVPLPEFPVDELARQIGRAHV